MPADTINTFDTSPAERELIKVGDDVEFYTETDEKQLFVGNVFNISSDGHKMFHDIKPIEGRENEFPNIRPSLVARITRGFIVRKLNPTN